MYTCAATAVQKCTKFTAVVQVFKFRGTDYYYPGTCTVLTTTKISILLLKVYSCRTTSILISTTGSSDASTKFSTERRAEPFSRTGILVQLYRPVVPVPIYIKNGIELGTKATN